MHGGLYGWLATSRAVHFAAAHGGAAGVSAKNVKPMNDSATNRSVHR